MTSLAEVYERGNGEATLQRLYLGVALFAVGAAFVLSGIVIASTDVGATYFGMSGHYEPRWFAGILGGLGVPATAVGILVVLPKAGRVIRGGAVVGALVCVVGVAFFSYAYPWHWTTNSPQYALPVTVIYFVGGVITLWCLFAGVANFKTRNDPGGTVKLEITKEGKTKIVEVEGNRLTEALGGVGVLSGTRFGDVETQTNHPAMKKRQATDGGSNAATTAQSTQHAEVTHAQPDPEPRPQTDPYCGNCKHFRYVRTDDGLTPYCGLDETLMDDMEPCTEWQFNADR